MTVISQLGMLLISVPVAVLRVYLLPNGNPIGMEANITFYGFGLLSFAVFNLIFLTSYFKTAYKVGKAFILGIIPSLIIGIVMEALSYIPATKWLDSTNLDMMIRQLPILVVGAASYVICTFVAYRISEQRFQHVDL